MGTVPGGKFQFGPAGGGDCVFRQDAPAPASGQGAVVLPVQGRAVEDVDVVGRFFPHAVSVPHLRGRHSGAERVLRVVVAQESQAVSRRSLGASGARLSGGAGFPLLPPWQAKIQIDLACAGALGHRGRVAGVGFHRHVRDGAHRLRRLGRRRLGRVHIALDLPNHRLTAKLLELRSGDLHRLALLLRHQEGVIIQLWGLGQRADAAVCHFSSPSLPVW